jgi:hypothetical protein
MKLQGGHWPEVVGRWLQNMLKVREHILDG